MATSGSGEKRFLQKPEERGEHLRELLKGSWNCTPKRSKDSKPVPTGTQRATTQHSWLTKRSGGSQAQGIDFDFGKSPNRLCPRVHAQRPHDGQPELLPNSSIYSGRVAPSISPERLPDVRIIQPSTEA